MINFKPRNVALTLLLLTLSMICICCSKDVREVKSGSQDQVKIAASN